MAIAAEGEVVDAESVVDMRLGPDGIKNTEDDPSVSKQAAITQLGLDEDNDGNKEDRFSDEGSTDRIESVGFSGGIRRKLVLILNNRSGNPTILDRREELVK